ncbi:MAG: 3-oxoacyl-ACP reductase [Deltaproteobacteria bacterium]|jgi:3-oxoacyl-[acyl-carrier protein] reductase|nr:3-oxoacyl-ACP reductase [Deltaproteobacteria bacterium]
MGNLTGKFAIVTGGSRGIGRAIARRFLDDGASVAILARSTTPELASELDPSLQRILPIGCDISDEAQVKSAVASVIKRFGRIDILVNNSGITKDGMFHKMSGTDFEAVFRVNFGGAYLLCKEVIPIMREQSYGRIVNVVSISAIGGAVGQANYVASKAALIGLTKTLAKEGGVKNITVNCVAPGYTNTDMIKGMPPDVLSKFINQVPMKRVGEPEEIASAVSFLASDDASYITGECLSVSGGLAA